MLLLHFSIVYTKVNTKTQHLHNTSSEPEETVEIIHCNPSHSQMAEQKSSFLWLGPNPELLRVRGYSEREAIWPGVQGSLPCTLIASSTEKLGRPRLLWAPHHSCSGFKNFTLDTLEFKLHLKATVHATLHLHTTPIWMHTIKLFWHLQLLKHFPRLFFMIFSSPFALSQEAIFSLSLILQTYFLNSLTYSLPCLCHLIES